MDKVINIKVIKPKSVIIDGDLHYKFKVLCKGKSMKIGGVIEDLIKLYIKDPKKLQGMIEELKEKEFLQVGAFRVLDDGDRIK
jgi:hypothetical protein